MKKIYAISAALVAIASVCSCTKQELKENENIASGETQTIRAYVNVGTKVAFSENTAGGGAGMTSVWAEGDFFYAIQDGSKVVRFDIESGIGTNYAGFVAETTGATESTAWMGVLGEAAEPKSTEIHCGFLGQDGTLANLDKCVYITASATGLEPVFNFNTGTKLSYVLRVKLPAGIKCIEYTPSSYQKVTTDAISEVCYNSTEQNDYSATNCSTITLSSLSTEGQLVYIAVPAVNFSHNRWGTWASGEQYGNFRTGVILTIMNGSSDDATASTGVVINSDLSTKGGIIGTCDMSGMTLMKRPAVSEAICVQKETVDAKFHASAYHQKASVETYWAPFNIGANEPYEVGGYYAFGEYQTKSTYTFPSYTLRHQTKSTNRDDYIAASYPKMVNNSDNTTFYSVAGSKFDTARVLWGSAWRMPHGIEVWGLFKMEGINTTTLGGKNVVSVPNGNGSYIYIPYSNLYANGNTISQKESGYDAAYIRTADKMNRSYNNAGWNQAYCVTMPTSGELNPDYWRQDHFSGVTIRPVLASSVIN